MTLPGQATVGHPRRAAHYGGGRERRSTADGAGRDAVGGKADSACAAREEEQAQYRGMHVNAVGNHRGPRGRRQHRGRRGWRISMIKRRHRVERMGEHPRARADRRLRLLQRGIGVAERHRNPPHA